MNKVLLKDSPLSYQLSARLNNLIRTYEAKNVFDMIKVAFSVYKSPCVWDKEGYKPNRNDAQLMLLINCVQLVRYFGEEFVREYVTNVYGKKDFMPKKQQGAG